MWLWESSTGKFPPTSRISPSILQLCNNLTSLLNDTQQQQQQHTHRPTPNLTQAEKHTLKQLKSNNSVILKPANKGGKLVLQHRDHYQLEALRQLNDREFYKPLSAPIYLQMAALIKHCQQHPTPGLHQQMSTTLPITTKQPSP